MNLATASHPNEVVSAESDSCIPSLTSDFRLQVKVFKLQLDGAEPRSSEIKGDQRIVEAISTKCYYIPSLT